jgi:hypothetical protein
MDSRIDQSICISFARSFVRLLENVLEAGQQLLYGVYVLRPAECQLKMTNVLGNQAPA